MDLKVGLFVGREWSFPPKFLEEVNNRNAGVTAEFVKIGGTHMNEPCPYSVIVDRISHEVPYYRSYLKNAVLQGTTVINNPFMWTADDKFFGASLITRLGLTSPKTIVLPNKDYIPGIIHPDSLRNLAMVEWDAVIEHVGLPCVLKDAHGGGWKEVYICHSKAELISNYDQSGLLTMIVQEFIEWDEYIRCLCLGQKEILPMIYDPHERRYKSEAPPLAQELEDLIIHDSLKLVQAFGYDMNTAEFAVKDGIPYAIDFMNPAPDMDIYSLTQPYFDWAIKHMADMVIDLAQNPREEKKALRWDDVFMANRAK